MRKQEESYKQRKETNKQKYLTFFFLFYFVAKRASVNSDPRISCVLGTEFMIEPPPRLVWSNLRERILTCTVNYGHAVLFFLPVRLDCPFRASSLPPPWLVLSLQLPGLLPACRPAPSR